MSIITKQVAAAATTPATTSVEAAQTNFASVKVTKGAKVIANSATPPTLSVAPVLSVERAMTDDSASIVKQNRAHYVASFKRGAEQTARSTLDTCRIVYEAHCSLDSYEFANFCKEIGYNDNSSSIRKLIAIGKVQPRFIQYADQMPNAWTVIYQITQIPADDFENYLRSGRRLDQLKGQTLKRLLDRTASVENLTQALPYDNDAQGVVFAKMVSLKRFDLVDWRAIEKAIAELEARLPIKFVVATELKRGVEQQKLRRYEKAKKHYANAEYRPETWDMGEEANSVLPRAQDEVVEVK
jgi:hypothetical protein